MIWGVGTGHCGTRSLAQWLDVPHEPKRGELGDHMKTYFGSLPPELEQRLRQMLSTTEGRGMVDSHLSPLIYLIQQADPEARIVWVWRDYPHVRRSHMRIGVRQFVNTIHPTGGFNDWLSLEDKVWWYWYTCNMGIYQQLLNFKRDHWVIVEADRLPVREGVTQYGSDEDTELRGYHQASSIHDFLRGLEHEQREENGLPVLW